MKYIYFLIAFLFLAPFSLGYEGLGDWIGQVLINDQIAPDGTQICAYVNGVENSRTTVGAYAPGYYLITVVGKTGDNVTFAVFCDSKFLVNSTFSWAPSPPRHKLNLSIPYSSTVGDISSINYNGNLSSVQINGSPLSQTQYYSDVQNVSIESNEGPLVIFPFNFTEDYLNLSKINISTGTYGQKAYISVSGIKAAGKKSLFLYNVTQSYNGICVKDAEGVSYLDISESCTGSNETFVPCPGSTSGIICSKSGNSLSVSGLSNSAVIQFNIPSSSSGGGSGSSGSSSSTSSGGGGGGGGGGVAGPASSRLTSSHVVDIGIANCTIQISREISSSNTSSVVSTVLKNTGDEICDLKDFVFADTIPANFAAINEISFTPQYSSREGWKVIFSFPSFSPGESKAIAYKVNGWVPPSRLQNFTTVEVYAKKVVASQQPQEQPQQPQPQPQPPQPQPTQPPAQKETGDEKAQQSSAPPIPQPQSQEPDIVPIALAAFIVFAGIAVAVAVIYFTVKRKMRP
ncbi:MAG: hypothetical protein QXN37_00050 [Candidatus Anstonellaceae archaeon]